MTPHRTTLWVGTIGTATGAAYAVVYALQRAMSPFHHVSNLFGAAMLYVVVTVVLFALYVTMAILAWRGRLNVGAPWRLTLLLPVAFAIALTCVRPSLSIDVLTYIGQGEQAVTGTNPYAQPLRALASAPLGVRLEREGWLPVHGKSPYGPLWTGIEAFAVRATSSIRSGMLLLKIVATAFGLASGWLIWMLLDGTPANVRMLGTVLYLWNPVVAIELWGEGHNDGAMICFALLSLLLVLRRRHTAATVALATGALMKIVAALVAPLELAYAWRTTRARHRLVAAVVGGVAISLALAAATYAPLWIGTATFDGLREHSRPSVLPSTQGTLLWWLTRSHSEDASSRLLSLSMTGLFLCVAGAAAASVRDRPTLLRACGWFAVTYVVLAPGYWPWYACLPIALLALAPSASTAAAILALSVGSRLAAPIDALRLNGVMTWEQEVVVATLVGVWIPAAAIVGSILVPRLRAVTSRPSLLRAHA